MNKLFSGVLTAAAVLIGVAGLATGHLEALVVLVPASLYLVRLAFDVAAGRHAPPTSASEAGVPTTHLETDDGTPLGDSAELHDELTPHDLPVNHPARPEVERLTNEKR
jgi:hypothetical protein